MEKKWSAVHQDVGANKKVTINTYTIMYNGIDNIHIINRVHVLI